jgi:hypothetical protein
MGVPGIAWASGLARRDKRNVAAKTPVNSVALERMFGKI